MGNIYKVTSVSIGNTKRGYKIFKLQLNNSIWATKLFPLRKYDREYDKLYLLYNKKGTLDFLVGKFISVYIGKGQYGYQFGQIDSFDVLGDFKNEIDSSKGRAFSTKLPIFEFLSKIMHRDIEQDGSIKLSTDFGDMRISIVNGVNVCYQHDRSNEYLNIYNIGMIFDKFYKDVPLPPYTTGLDQGKNSYYMISMIDVAIVKMNNHVKVSWKMTTSGDYDKWLSSKVIGIGDKLSDEQSEYLQNSVRCQETT